ncbi:ATP-binding cassette domain-containing protein [Weissella diestrammenae]|uniref:ATP-binding cassette domain-containing protein n=2 Tax=Weissella diestrammenae TaxID=1162633 RepID=A0A7G9T7H5_9LACO|nr:ATP-binding cassette domain-containing protein [Weissella diestrammenae]QNN76050.1 ATP-binding cassette domain-containing protein [Weissella diestrammenae]
MTTLSTHQLNFTYQSDQQPILNNISLTLNPNSFNLLIGVSGSGKSTLLKLLAGLYPKFAGKITAGEVLLNAQPVADIVPYERAQHVAMLFQNPLRQFAMATPYEEVKFALGNLQFDPNEMPDRIQSALAFVGITHLAHHQIRHLSGGEQQKVALATIIAMDADIILLDEPFANIDPMARQSLLTALQKLQQTRGKTIFISDHDLSGYDGLVDCLYQLHANGQLNEASLNLLKAQPTTVQFENRMNQQVSPLSWQNLQVQLSNTLLIQANEFSIPYGQIGIISGPNGAGKTTFFKALTQQIAYTGQITWHQKSLSQLRPKQRAKVIGYGFQTATDQFVTMTVEEEILLSKKQTQSSEFWTSTRIEKSLKQLQLSDLLSHVVYRLSGGQQKKLQILSLLILNLPILLFDEPFAGLDKDSLNQVLTLMRNYVNQTGHSILLISHQRHGLENFIDFELTMTNHKLHLLGEDSIHD